MGFFLCDVLSEESNKDIQVFFSFFFFLSWKETLIVFQFL